MRNTLWAIGEALGDDIIEQQSGTVRLNPTIEVDVHALEDQQRLLHHGDLVVLEQIVAHTTGILADGLSIQEAPDFELWLTTERERLVGTDSAC